MHNDYIYDGVTQYRTNGYFSPDNEIIIKKITRAYEHLFDEEVSQIEIAKVLLAGQVEVNHDSLQLSRKGTFRFLYLLQGVADSDFIWAHIYESVRRNVVKEFGENWKVNMRKN